MLPVLVLLLLASAPVPAQTDAAAAQAGANLPAQPVGSNDLIAVSVYGAPELTRTVRVAPDGWIRLPMVKQRIKAEGLLPAEVEAALARVLEEEQILVDPHVTVTIAEYHSRPISVMGAVRRPVVFQASAPVTLLEAVARAEGLREDAGAEILVSRRKADAAGGPVTLTRRIPVRGLIDAADASLNLVLTGGEEVRVPESPRIYIVGNVRKPGAFPLREAETTVLQVLALAEGLTPFANKEAFIYRREAAGEKNEIPIPLQQIMQRKAPDVPLLANDILYVPDNKGRRLGLAALEKILLFGSTAGATALIYGQVR